MKKRATKSVKVKKKTGMTSKKLWPRFSQCLRKEAADHAGYVRCVSCSATSRWQDFDLGHFWRNNERVNEYGGNALWYDERNFSPQCRTCNYYHVEEASKVWAVKLVAKYGAGVVEEMDALRQKAKMFSSEELQKKWDELTQRLAKL